MNPPEVLQASRDLLECSTPLKTDCGRLCGHICCAPRPGEELSGMLLFPGEAAFYEHLPDYTIHPLAGRELLVCSGRCKRTERPLACRLFPLLPRMKDGRVAALRDLRGKAVCPLYKLGREGLDADFVARVVQVGEMLYADPVQVAFLDQLWQEQDDLKALAKQFGA